MVCRHVSALHNLVEVFFSVYASDDVSLTSLALRTGDAMCTMSYQLRGT